MSTLLKLQRALKLVPAEEHITNRDFILHNNNLYFAGDRMWFIIENFMQSDANCRLTYQELVPVVSIQGDVTGQYAGGSSVKFTNGKHVLTLHPVLDSVSKPAHIQPLSSHEYQSLPELLVRGKSLFPLINDYSSVCIMTHLNRESLSHEQSEQIGYLALLNDKAYAIVEGEPGLDMDVTDIPEVIQGMISQNAKIAMDGQVVHAFIEDTKSDYAIYASVKYGRNRFPELRQQTIHDVAHGCYETHSDEAPVVRIEVKASELAALLPVLKNLKHQQTMTLHCVDSIMRVTIVDTTNNTFQSEFPCVMTEEIKAEIPVIDRDMLTFLIVSAGVTMDEAIISFSINIRKYRLILRAINSEARNSLLMTKVIL